MNFLRRHIGLLILIFVSLIPLLDMLHLGFPLTHDGKDHVARIANFYQSLSEGNIIPRWAGNLNWGYGHPVMMFLYPFPSYVASGLHHIGFSLVDSTKLVFVIAYVVSIVAMYGWAGSVWGKRAGIVAAMLYGFAPYRFVDLYVRGAIGEHMAFVFLPVILWGLWQISNSGYATRASSFLAVSGGIASLILSHNASSLMFLPIAACYALYLYWIETKQKGVFFLLTACVWVWGITMASFFWIPAFFEGKYTLRDIVTAGEFRNRFVHPLWFLWSPWNYGGGNDFSKSLGIAQIISMALVIWNRKMLKGKDTLIAIGASILLFGSLLMMTEFSHYAWQHITLIQKFQFPWRMLSVSVFATSVLGALALVSGGKKQIHICIVLIIIAVVSTGSMWHAKIYQRFDDSIFTSVYAGTTDTGESSPIWSVRFMEHVPVAPIQIISGTGNIEVIERTSVLHRYKISAQTPVQLVENTLYFPGWDVFVDRTVVPIEFQNPTYRGLMTFEIAEGNHSVSVLFGKTRVRRAAELVSLVSFVSFLIFLGTISLWSPKKQRSLSQ